LNHGFSAVALFDRVRSYQNIPFQFSCHVVRSENGELEHRHFLAAGAHDHIAKRSLKSRVAQSPILSPHLRDNSRTFLKAEGLLTLR
jgi:hypothetical protein